MSWLVPITGPGSLESALANGEVELGASDRPIATASAIVLQPDWKLTTTRDVRRIVGPADHG